MNLSICIIAHNEEEKLGDTLESARFADEVIVVDCGSSDATPILARSFGVRLFSRPNLTNLNVNKNFAFAQAGGDWILCLDADEVVPEQTAEEIRGILAGNPRENGFFLPRRNHLLGRRLRFGGSYPDYQLRLFRRGKGRFPEKHVHERLQVEGAVGYLRSPLEHYPYVTKEECRRKLDLYTSFEADYLYKQNVRPSLLQAFRFLVWQPFQRFMRRYLFKLGFLDGRVGWCAIMMDMSNFRLRYLKLRRLVRQRGIRK